MNTTVSIIVASHRPGYIAACVEHIMAAAARAGACQIIVVADYDIQSLSSRFPEVCWIHDPCRGIPHKRNRGILQAGGVLVGFTDDDCRPSPEWIASARAFLREHPNHAGVEGKTIIECGALKGAYREAVRLERSGYRTNNIFYRRVALDRAGLFDTRFAFQREDADLAFTLEELGLSIGYCEQCLVHHCLRPGEPWDLLKNCWNRRYDPLLYKKHPALYRRTVGSPFPPAIRAMLAAHGIALACAITGRPGAAITAGVLDVGIALFLGVRRTGLGARLPTQVWYEWISYFVAPLVLQAALILGSVRFRKALLT